jgi:lipid II:glycine glycyltransferase (peptidoglycan interpeptide bridge formation enzyme)
MIEVVKLNEGLHDRYTSFLAGRPDTRFGHDLAWGNVLRDTYGVEIEHLVALEGEKVVGVCPFFLCKPIIGGAHYVTNPFPTYCGPVYDSADTLNALLKKVAEKTSSVDHAEVLTPAPLLNAEAGLLPFEEGLDYTFKLSLGSGVDKIHKNLRTNFKRILNKSAKLQGMDILTDMDGSLLDEFYKSYVRIYGHKHGFIPHVKKLFENIFTHFKKGDARLYMARINGKYAGGIFTFWAHNEVYYAWSAVEPDNEYQPAHSVIWRIIQDAALEGYDCFNMGEAPRAHETLILFKQGWGTEVLEPSRYFIPGRTKHPPERLFDRVSSANKIIAILPDAVITNLLSPAIRYFI